MLYEAIFRTESLVKKRQKAYALPLSSMEEDSFRSFYLEIAPALQGYIRKTCGNAALAEDILQEAFYRFLRSNLPEMDSPQMKAYLFKTATTLLIDHWRREKRENFWKNLRNPSALRRNDQREDVSNALSELKPAERALLWLAYVEGFDHGEIASALGFKEKSIRVLLFRSRKKLARILERRAGNNRVTV
jgi:RNA polymerase sigma-70 factor (ECF subfamily)